MSNVVDRLNAALSDRYRIERRLGEGGMATVYLADDLRHERKVALKVLKPELAAVVGAERFLAEIKTTANLQHPHILPLFDSGEADGFLFYVMPFVEGESLRERIDREKQLPVDEAVRIAKAVASALDRAHEQGVIHRDIKPANILLGRGDPLVADFGIALAISAAGGTRLTETGLSVGTPFYMSPEQATGDRELNPSSDVYALACVLFEMLIGEPPYTGSTAQAILGKIITERPPRATASRDTVPTNVEGAILRALEKLPADRFLTAASFADALDDSGFRYGDAAGERAGSRAARSPWPIALPWAVAAALLLASIPRWLTTDATTFEHLGISLPDSAEVALRPLAPLGVARHALAVAPDGQTIVYSGYDGSVTRLYRRPLGEFEPIPIPGTEGASDPFFSPDGESLAFFQGTQLKRISMRGGDPFVICEAPNAYGGYWGEDGDIVFATNEGQRLATVPATGGEPERIEGPGMTGSWWFSHPEPLPGGRALLASGRFPRHIVAVTLPDGAPKLITEGERPRFLEPDYLVFARGSTIMLARFDPDELTLTTDPIPVVSGVRSEHNVAQFEVSSDGTLYFVPGRNADRGPLVWADFDGGVDTLPFAPREYQRAFVSSDGRRVATLIAEGSIGLYVLDLETGDETRIDGAPEMSAPLWSPDGTSLVYGISPTGGRDPTQLVRRSISGAETQRVAEFGGPVWASAWSPGSNFLVADVDVAGRSQLFTVPLDSVGEPVQWLGTEYNTWGASISPDEEWLAYTSDESGQYQVFVESFARTGQRFRISAHDNSEEPLWSPDGSTVFYRASNQWWAVDVAYDPEFTHAPPRLAVEGAYLNVPGHSYDVHPDGDRLLLIDTPREETADRIHLIRNWVDQLEGLLPGR